MFFKKTDAMLGIAFSAQALHLIAISSKNPSVLIAASKIPLPENIFLENDSTIWSFIHTELKKIILQQQLSGAATTVVLPYALTRLQIMRLVNNLSKADMQLEIKQRLRQEMPALTDDIGFDYQIEAVDNAFLANVHVLMTRKKYLHELIKLCKLSNLALQIIDVDFFVIARLIAWQYQTSILNKYYLVLLPNNMGYQLLICQQGDFLACENYSQDFVQENFNKNIQLVLERHHLPLKNTVVFLPPLDCVELLIESQVYLPFAKLDTGLSFISSMLNQDLYCFASAIGAAYSLQTKQYLHANV